jgi:transcription termination/antitermination protein NusG
MDIDWYVLRTISGKEDVIYSIFQKIFSEFEIIYPKRRIGWRKNGRIISLVRPMFEGYLFISTDKILIFEQLLRRYSMNNAWFNS